jgi:hypothetical protein
MNIEQRLDDVARRYQAQGYKVTVRPGPDALPSFAKDFRVEIIADRNDGCVLASVKKNQSDLEADLEIPRYAEITGKQPGWRFDVIVMGSENEPMRDKKEATEPSEGEVRRALADIERIIEAGFVAQALIAAWAVLETAMRRRLHTIGEEAGWGSSPRTMLNELYADGVLPINVLRDLERLYQARCAVVHGFTTPVIENSAVQFLVETARTLLDESILVSA